MKFPKEQESLAFRLSFLAAPSLKLQRHDRILVIAGQSGTPTWAAFTAIVIRHEPGSLLLFASLQYESRLKDVVRLELLFSPLTSITGIAGVIETIGFLPPFHYAEITHADLKAEDESLEKMLSITINDTTGDFSRYTVSFRFEGIDEANLSPFEKQNVLFQLEFSYAGEKIRVVLDAQTGFEGSFLCRKVSVRMSSALV
ncbi:Imm50 family immunity protein [Paenibacillus hodogayensis]|uniref:Imm50 family immunity protein n=1 Tax=Paenibacillus hodogayensis TaxID=279208 RepID=A0ABV5W2V8_9BACL